jgi:aminocarboxymuconate-semialdehyde decarboxylase
MGELWNSYDRTAAREPGARARVQGPVVDVHGHMMVEAAAEFVRPHLSPDPRAQFYTEETRELMRKQDDDRHRHLNDLDQRLRDLDAMGIDVQLVSPAPPQCGYAVSAEIAAPATRMVNDGVAAFVAQKPERLVGLGTVPLRAGGDAAAEELERCIRELGLKGVQIVTHVGEREISDPSFAAFWERAEELEVAVMIHPAGFTQARRFGRYYFNNVIGNPLDTTMALHYLIFDGVLERHPKLKLVAVHGGGYLPAYSGRADHAWGARSDSHGALPHPPSTYLKRVYVDAIVFTPHQLEALVALMGADHVMLGTDYPYDMGEYDPLDHLGSAKSLDMMAASMIAGGNASMVFGL